MRLAIGAAAAVVLLGVAGPASAAMTVEEFLAKVAGLKAKGPFALFSGDIGLLKRESAVAVANLAAEKKVRAAAGQPPLYCAADDTRMSASQMIAGLQRIPPAERRVSLQDGFRRVIVAAYPCR